MLRARVDRPILDALDAYVAAQADPRPSRPEAIRALLREGLTSKGLLDAVDDHIAMPDRIEVLEAKVASDPDHKKPCPGAGMNTIKRALKELPTGVEFLKHGRKA